MKIVDKVKNLIKLSNKDDERIDKEKKPRKRGVISNSDKFQNLPDVARSLSLNLPKYKFVEQKKKGSFTGYVVNHNRPIKKGPRYRGFISARIWNHYVLPGEKVTSDKVDFMIAVSIALKEGYQEPPPAEVQSPPVEGNQPEPQDGPVPYMRIAK